MNRRVILWIVAGLALSGLTVLQARNVAVTPPAPATPTAPRAHGLAAEGQVVTYPGYDVTVGAERAGRVVRVNFTEGKSVERGALLAELESDELRASLAEARAQLQEARAEVRLAEATLKRRQRLAAEKIASESDLDQALRDLDTARARTDTAQANVERYEAQLRKTRILAPFSGTVILRHVDAGQTVDSGSKIATLADLHRVRIEGEADEADAGSVVLGAPVIITAEGYPGRTWAGRVEEIPDSVTLRHIKPQDPGHPTDTRVLAVKVAFLEPTPLKLGTIVELQIGPKTR